jgi:superfamily II DNA or RNA helicase
LTLHNRAFCFNEQGTGKTASVIWAADYLIKRGEIKRVLVLCPLSIMKSAWQQDLFTFAMHRSCGVAHGDAKTRKKVVVAGADFVIVNTAEWGFGTPSGNLGGSKAVSRTGELLTQAPFDQAAITLVNL